MCVCASASTCVYGVYNVHVHVHVYVCYCSVHTFVDCCLATKSFIGKLLVIRGMWVILGCSLMMIGVNRGPTK